MTETKKLYISQLKKKYKIVYLHNPKHFFLNTLHIENLPGDRKLLCAYPRKHSKQFHHLALLKPKTSKKNKESSIKKPYNGILKTA